MISPQIKILIIIAVVSIIYAYVCNIRLIRMATRLSDWLQKERPDLWSKMNVVARNWNGGLPALKLLYRRNVVDLPDFNQQYGELHIIERRLFLGIVIGLLCIGLILIGRSYWGWYL